MTGNVASVLQVRSFVVTVHGPRRTALRDRLSVLHTMLLRLQPLTLEMETSERAVPRLSALCRVI